MNLYRLGRGRDGSEVSYRLCNFTARIAEEIIEDDGDTLTQKYVITNQMKNCNLPAIEVPADKFNNLNWVSQWGVRAVIEPGQSTRDYIRHGIQVLSSNVQRSHYFVHCGWRKVEDEMVFLTGTGAVGGKNVKVRHSKEMERYSLPAVPENEAEAIKTSFSFLDIAKSDITFPLFSFLYLSPLTTILDPMPNFSGYIYGESGTFKTTLASLLLCHFGDFLAVQGLSGFDDTLRSLEKRGFTLKDSLMLLDDYHPSHDRKSSQGKENIAQGLIRAFANRTARHRLKSDATERGAYSPRGMLMITAEELIIMQSTLARTMVIEIEQGDIDRERLTELQGKAHQLPHAMTSFLLWLKPQLKDIQSKFREQFIQLRERAFKEGDHRRLPEMVAFLQYGLDLALSWAMDKGALTETEAARLSEKGWAVFTATAKHQAQCVEGEDPVTRFAEVFTTLLDQGKVRLDGLRPGEFMGWDKSQNLGFFDADFLYILPAALWNVIQKFCIAEGEHFPFRKHTLYKMLKNRGLLEVGKEGYSANNLWLKGATRKVIKITRTGPFQDLKVKQEEEKSFSSLYGKGSDE